MKFYTGQVFECQTEFVQDGMESRLVLLDISITGQVTLDDGHELTSQVKVPIERLDYLVSNGYWEEIKK